MDLRLFGGERHLLPDNQVQPGNSAGRTGITPATFARLGLGVVSQCTPPPFRTTKQYICLVEHASLGVWIVQPLHRTSLNWQSLPAERGPPKQTSPRSQWESRWLSVA
jgi:hypothetical protein